MKNNLHNPIRVVPATKEDALLIAKLSRETFFETFAPVNTSRNMDLFMSGQFAEEHLKKELDLPGYIFFLAFEAANAVGYALMRDDPEKNEDLHDSIEIARIYAVKQSVGKGVGAALMNQCIGFARQQKKTWLWLGVWEHNVKAIAFYRKWGFERFGEHDFMLGTDLQLDWLMRKKLV